MRFSCSSKTVRVVMVALNRRDFAPLASKEISGIEQLRGKVIGGYTAQGTVNLVLTEPPRGKGLRTDEYKILNVETARARRSGAEMFPPLWLTVSKRFVSRSKDFTCYRGQPTKSRFPNPDVARRSPLSKRSATSCRPHSGDAKTARSSTVKTKT